MSTRIAALPHTSHPEGTNSMKGERPCVPRRWHRWLAACLVLLGSRGVWAVEPPTADQLGREAERCRRMLLASVVDFYLPHCVDTEHGGYLEELDESGQFVAGRQKFLTLQARQLWFFSTLAAEGIRKEEALQAARQGYDFLQRCFYDPQHGGYYSTVSNDGRPIDRRKHAYLNSFALYAFTAYYQASRDPAALESAQALFQVLENRVHDGEHGGYQEFFYADWRPVLDPTESGYVGAIGTKTYNTHLHLLEAFTALYRVWPDPLLARRLSELVQINTTTVRHPEYACNIDGWERDWTMIDTPQNLRASYGHDVEAAWLVLDAGAALGWPADVLRNWAVSLGKYGLQFGYDSQHGGFFYSGLPGQPASDRRKEWWVQAEALVSMLYFYGLTGDKNYYRAFAETLDFVEHHQVARQGGWWSTVESDGTRRPSAVRSSMWQGAYHSGRALIICSQLLADLQNRDRSVDEP